MKKIIIGVIGLLILATFFLEPQIKDVPTILPGLKFCNWDGGATVTCVETWVPFEVDEDCLIEYNNGKSIIS